MAENEEVYGNGFYVIIENNDVKYHGLSLDGVKKYFNNISFPTDPSLDFLQSIGVSQIMTKVSPTYNILTETVVENKPVLENGKYIQSYSVLPLNDSEKADAIISTKNMYDSMMAAHFDAVARTKNYDSRITCAMRAGYDGPFKAEGVAFAQWMDTCNSQAYTLLQAVVNGSQALPEIKDFIDALPKIVW